MSKFFDKIRRIPLWLKLTTALAVVIIVAGGILGWLVSSKLVAINPQTITYDQTITAIKGDRYAIQGSAYDIVGTVGAYRSDGSMIGVSSSGLASTDTKTKTTVRTFDNISGPALSVGQKISLQGNVWISNPQEAFNVPYQNITYPSPLGAMSAWLITDGDSHDWTIGVHGIGADKTEMLRFVGPVIGSGNTMMIINYRNDVGNPRSPDNRNHLGDTEWQDLQAAVQYAKQHGATNVTLYGDSLGGSIVENYLRRSPSVAGARINRVILDSPALNWESVVKSQLVRGGYPSILYYPTSIVLKLRTGISLQEISTTAKDIDRKTLIIQSADDPTVPQAPNKQLARQRKDLVTLLDLGSCGHLRSWNCNQDEYESAVKYFLSD